MPSEVSLQVGAKSELTPHGQLAIGHAGQHEPSMTQLLLLHTVATPFMVVALLRP